MPNFILPPPETKDGIREWRLTPLAIYEFGAPRHQWEKPLYIVNISFDRIDSRVKKISEIQFKSSFQL